MAVNTTSSSGQYHGNTGSVSSTNNNTWNTTGSGSSIWPNDSSGTITIGPSTSSWSNGYMDNGSVSINQKLIKMQLAFIKTCIDSGLIDKEMFIRNFMESNGDKEYDSEKLVSDMLMDVFKSLPKSDQLILKIEDPDIDEKL